MPVEVYNKGMDIAVSELRAHLSEYLDRVRRVCLERDIAYELMTTDPKAAEAFYRGVIGWGAQDAGMPDMSYTLLTAGVTWRCHSS